MIRQINKQILLIFMALLFIFTSSLFAQSNRASITGSVVDDVDGAVLPGVNLIIKGTYYGTASAIDGRYIIKGISSGSYDLEVSMIGYTRQLIAGIELQAGEIKKLDIRLERTVLALVQEITVIGERPIIDADATSSSVSFKASELEGQIVENVMEIVSQQLGVSESDNEIHIRGGRADEGQFIIDGLAIKDPLTGTTS
ncbi:MAG: carboxypeptidase-like regulatory domain-containing protein, partial [Candidatus Marinimicrobia bacterium]|nr:carboxypeptidase-like regulatory domain-containing protein [Candidatus Neomarinimicrobiota bacterium]